MTPSGGGRGPQRRLVHVLFADLVGFTTLVEQLDAEDVALLQEQYFDRAREAVEAAGGQVEKFVGDAVLAVFGLPVLHEEDARRAVATGLTLVAAVADLGRGLGLGPDALRLRVGVHTGEVVVSWTADGASWRLSGDVVNTASRLQSAARPGQVVAGPETALAVADAFVLDPLGAVELRGRTGPVSAWGVGPARPDPGRDRRPRPPLVGRDADLARLAAVAGDPLVTVVAPPGVGRTRLVEEFRDRARARDEPVWLAVVRSPQEGYAPVADLLRQALGWVGGMPDDTAAHAVLTARLHRQGRTGPRAELSARHTLALLTGGGAADGAPADLWTSWTAVLDAEPGPAPVWVLDDVHRAAPDLLAFLDHALDAPFRADRGVVVTARPGRTGRWARRSTTVPLDPLADADVTHLVEAALAPRVLAPDLVAAIAAAASGNPFYVVELVRAWRQAGGEDPAPDRVPSTVRAIYLGQLDDLPGPSRAVLESGSVAGTVLPAPALPELGVPDAVGALEDLTGSGLLTGPHDDPVGPPAYTYRHVLLRDAAYGALPRSRRATLHLRFARWLETRPVTRRAERIGMHLVAAWEQAPALGGAVDGLATRDELAGRAAALLTEAGEARLATEPQRAAQLFVRARDLGGGGPSPATAHRQLRVGRALHRAGRLLEAVEAFDAVGDLAADDDHRTLAAAALGFEDALFDSRLARTVHNPRVLALLERAAAATPAGDLATRSRLRAAGARARAYGGDAVSGEAAAREALAMARTSGDPGAGAYALLALRPALAAPGRLAERLHVDAELLAAAGAAGDPEREFEALRLGFVDHLERGDTARSEELRRRAEDAVPGLGQPQYLWYPPMWRAMAALHRGDLDAAGDLVEEFRREGERWHYRDTDQVHAVQLLALQTGLGTPQGAVAALTAAFARVGDRLRPSLGVALARAGRPAEAAVHLEALRPDAFAVLPHDGARSFVLAHAAELADALGDAAAGADVYRLLAPWDGLAVVVGSGALCEGAVGHFLGLAARAAGDLPRAAAHLRAAVAMNDALGAPLHAERSRRELARIPTPTPGS